MSGVELTAWGEERVYCACGKSVRPENWANHLLAKHGRHAPIDAELRALRDEHQPYIVDDQAGTTWIACQCGFDRLGASRSRSFWTHVALLAPRVTPDSTGARDE